MLLFLLVFVPALPYIFVFLVWTIAGDKWESRERYILRWLPVRVSGLYIFLLLFRSLLLFLVFFAYVGIFVTTVNRSDD